MKAHRRRLQLSGWTGSETHEGVCRPKKIELAGLFRNKHGCSISEKTSYTKNFIEKYNYRCIGKNRCKSKIYCNLKLNFRIDCSCDIEGRRGFADAVRPWCYSSATCGEKTKNCIKPSSTDQQMNSRKIGQEGMKTALEEDMKGRIERWVQRLHAKKEILLSALLWSP